MFAWSLRKTSQFSSQTYLQGRAKTLAKKSRQVFPLDYSTTSSHIILRGHLCGVKYRTWTKGYPKHITYSLRNNYTVNNHITTTEVKKWNTISATETPCSVSHYDPQLLIPWTGHHYPGYKNSPLYGFNKQCVTSPTIQFSFSYFLKEIFIT